MLLAVAGIGAGILVGRYGGITFSTPTERLPDSKISAADANKLRAVCAAAAAKNSPRRSLAEIESALTELKSWSHYKLSERVSEIAPAVAAADIPERCRGRRSCP